MRFFPSILTRLLSRLSAVFVPTPMPNSNGPSALPASPQMSKPYAETPQAVSAGSAPVVLSTNLQGRGTVNMLSLVTIADAVASAFEVGEELVEDVAKLKPFVSQLMNAAESTYAQQTGAGESKLTASLAAIKAVAAQLGISWSSGLQSALTAIINAAKAAFNAFESVVNAATGSPAPGTAAA